MTKSKFSFADKDPAFVELIEKTDHKILAMWVIDCVERVMPYFEEAYPEDQRPRQALETLQTWLDTDALVMTVIRDASLDSHTAANEVGEDNPASCTAHAAGLAVATTHVRAHAIDAINYVLEAIYRAADDDMADVAVSQECGWQYQHLVELNED